MPPRTWIACLAVACATFAPACGRGTDYAALHERLERGRIEDVERALLGDDGANARTLRALAQRMRERRDGVQAAIARLREERDGLTSRELITRLRALKDGVRDEVIREWVDTELSAALDWAAARPPELDGELPPLPGKPYEAPLDASPRPSPGAGSTGPDAARAEAGDATAGAEIAAASDDASSNAAAPAENEDVAPSSAVQGAAAPASVGEVERAEGALRASAPALDSPLLRETQLSSSEKLGRDEPALPEGEPARSLERFTAARGAERDARYAELAALAERHPTVSDAIARALGERFERAASELARTTIVTDLARVRERRAALDFARAYALELVLDARRFFDPSDGDRADLERAGELARVRNDVLERVADVREIWDSPLRGRISAPARAALEEIAWTRARALERGFRLAAPPGAEEWTLAQDPHAETIGVREIATSFADADALERDRRVVARNEAAWADGVEHGPRAAHEPDRALVRLCNEHRRMLGRAALAWNPRLQEAARLHTEWMAQRGVLEHAEPDPERASPALRARAAGYPSGRGECIYRGSPSPEVVHAGWIASGPHHRILLDAGATEVGCSHVSGWWTLDTGADREFEKELPDWAD